MDAPDRRQLLRLAGTGLAAALAGCGRPSDNDEEEGGGGGEGGGEGGETETGGGEEGEEDVEPGVTTGAVNDG